MSNGCNPPCHPDNGNAIDKGKGASRGGIRSKPAADICLNEKKLHIGYINVDEIAK